MSPASRELTSAGVFKVQEDFQRLSQEIKKIKELNNHNQSQKSGQGSLLNNVHYEIIHEAESSGDEEADQSKFSFRPAENDNNLLDLAPNQRPKTLLSASLNQYQPTDKKIPYVF